MYAVILDTRPDVIQAERSSGEVFKVDRQRMANEAQMHPEKVQVFRQHVQEALACAPHPVAPEKLDDILLQASATVFAGKPEAQPPNAWQQPETAIRLQDVWEHRAEHLRLAKQVRIAFLCIRYRAARSMWNFWAQHVRFQRARKALRRTSQRLRKAKLIQQLENAEQALARHDTHAFFAVIQQLAPKQARGRVQLKGDDGGMLTAEAEIDALHTYWDGIFNDGAQAHDTLLTEDVFVAASEVLDVVAKLPMRKAAMPGRAPCAAWKLAAEDVAPHLHAYVQQAWAPGPVHVPLYLTEAWLHFMSKPGRTLRTPGDLRPLALQTGGGKALSRLLKNQLTPFAERAALHVPQFAYLRNRDTHSAIARALSHIDKVRSITHGGQRLSIHARKAGVQQQRCAGGATLSLDLSRAFDSVGHDVLWEALSWAAVPLDLATLLMTWYRSEYALGQRGADGYTRRISITKGVKQGCVIAPTIWVILTCFVHHRLDERLTPAWSERHATCFADDFLFQWVLESMQACKAMCTDVSVIYEVFASLGLCINSKKSAFLLKLVGPEAEAWLAKHRVLAPEGVEAKHVLRYDLFRRCDVPIKHTHVYLGIALTYDSYEEASMRHRLRLAAIQKHRLSRILQGRGGLTVRCRLRLWRVAIATSMLYATHVVGLTRASLRSAHVMMTKHLRAILKSPRHLTQENDLAFLQSISQDTPLQLVLKAIGSMLDRASAPTDFPCFAVEDVMHRLRALRCNMISFSEAPAPRGMRLTEVPASAPVFTCQICGQQFATLHQVKNHEGRMHKVTAPTQSPLNASYIAKGGMPTCRFCGETFARWDNLRKHIQNFRCRSLRTTVKLDTPAVSEAESLHACPGPTIVREASAVAHSDRSPDLPYQAVAPSAHLPDTPAVVAQPHPEPTPMGEACVTSPNIWHNAQQTALQNRDVPVAEWQAVRQARILENIVQVPGVRESLVQTCCLCGQWVSATNGVRKHLRAAHASVWLKHETTILHRAKLWSKSAVSPCRLCHATIKKPREHPASCTVFAQALLIELECQELEGADHDRGSDHGATGGDGQAGDGIVRACLDTDGGGKSPGSETGRCTSGDGSGLVTQEATPDKAIPTKGQGQRAGETQGQGGGNLLRFFGARPGVGSGQDCSAAGGSATSSGAGHGVLSSVGHGPGSRHSHSHHVRGGGTLEKEANGDPRADHMFVGGHDDAVPTSGAQPCFENPGGCGGSNQAGDADGQAGLDVHALGQGQWEVDARSYAQPVVNQGFAADHSGCSKHATASPRGDHQVLQHSAARRKHSACSSAVPHRCVASGWQDVSNPESVVASECVASLARATAPGPGQAESCGTSCSQHDPSPLLSLRLKNEAGTNQCYANSSILALSWSVLQHGGHTASPLRALIRRLVQARRAQLITLRRLSEWEPIGRGWPRPLVQNDVAEFIGHLCARMQGLPDLCTWMVRRVEAAGVPREMGGNCPILLPLRRVCGAPHDTLQQSVQDWHMQIHLYGLAAARPLLILQLNRFSGCHPFGRKDAATISLEAGLIHMPCIAGGETVWMPYKIVSVIVHAGANARSGHYQTVLFTNNEGPSWQSGARAADDNIATAPLTSAELVNLFSRTYLVFLIRAEA